MITHEYNFTKQEDKTLITVTFTKEETGETILVAQTTILGDENSATSYLTTFISDLERNYPSVRNIEEPVEGSESE